MTDPKRSSLLQQGARFEELVLCLLLGFMILLACLQIALRTFFGGGLLWADPLLRYLVLWSGLLGAAMATSRGEHIALDLAGYLLPEKLQPLVQLACHLFSLITAGFLTWAAILFIQSEIEYSGPGLLDIPTWGWNAIFPLAFSLITLRCLILVVTTGTAMLHGHKNSSGAKQ
jgi:TRAP-type C4-dicarboxylate transport system permease small subunit